MCATGDSPVFAHVPAFPDPGKTHIPFENNVDLRQALAGMEAGLAEQPEAFWMIDRKGLILAKLGDKAGARAVAQQSIELAARRSGEIKEEYTRLNEALIASLRCGQGGRP